MWNRKKERAFIQLIKKEKVYLVNNIDFVELQLIEYAAVIDFDVREWGCFDRTELLDFFEWYLDEGLDGTLEIETVINTINFLHYTNFDPFMFEDNKQTESQ